MIFLVFFPHAFSRFPIFSHNFIITISTPRLLQILLLCSSCLITLPPILVPSPSHQAQRLCQLFLHSLYIHLPCVPCLDTNDIQPSTSVAQHPFVSSFAYVLFFTSLSLTHPYITCTQSYSSLRRLSDSLVFSKLSLTILSPLRGLTLLSGQVTRSILARGPRLSRDHIGHVYPASRFRSLGLFSSRSLRQYGWGRSFINTLAKCLSSNRP